MTRAWRIFVLVCAAASCKRAPTPDKAPIAAASARSSVVVDDTLVAQGRIALGAVERRAPRSELRVPGEIRPSERGSAEAGTLVAGRVASIEVADASHVNKGQVLAWIDAPEVGRAAADLVRARARAALAARKLERQLDLERQLATSKNAVDDARAEDQAARADVLAARTLLANLGGQEPPADIDRATAIVRVPVRAPIQGIVTERSVVVGAPVTPEKSLFRLVAEGRVTVLARVPETSPLPSDGTQATLIARGAATTTCTGTVTGTLGAVDETTRTYAVRLAPESGCGWLIAGGYVDVVFPGALSGRGTELLIPRSALVDIGGVSSIFAPGEGAGEYRVRAVRVRPGTGAELVVESGLAEGDRIVVGGTLLLKGELQRAELEGTP